MLHLPEGRPAIPELATQGIACAGHRDRKARQFAEAGRPHGGIVEQSTSLSGALVDPHVSRWVANKSEAARTASAARCQCAITPLWARST